MRPEARDAAYLRDIPDAGREAVSMTATASREAFEQNKPLRLAVERLMTTVGEAARRFPTSSRPHIPRFPGPVSSLSATC
jgi:uncharacterized protein with HEPN domain